MPIRPSFKLAVLCAVGLLATLAGGSKPARSAAKSDDCQVKILNFAELAYLSHNGATAYQFTLSFEAIAPAGDEVNGDGSISGGGGEYEFSSVRNMHTGVNTFIQWTADDWGGDHSHAETLDLTLYCYGDSGGTDATDNASSTIHLYWPGEPQPLVQPWINGCPDELVIDSRGSTETAGTISPPGQIFANELRLQYYTRNFYGTNFVIESLANPYPAKGDVLKYILAKLPVPSAYRRSEAAGVKWLKWELGQVRSHCPDTAVYLSGYSQGAQVTGDVYQLNRWPNVRGAVLFGDLKFNPVDVSDHGNFDRSTHWPLGQLRHGYLGSRPRFGTSRVWSFCHLHDPACQGWTQAGHGFTYHDNYDRKGEPQLAARFFTLNP